MSAQYNFSIFSFPRLKAINGFELLVAIQIRFRLGYLIFILMRDSDIISIWHAVYNLKYVTELVIILITNFNRLKS